MSVQMPLMPRLSRTSLLRIVDPVGAADLHAARRRCSVEVLARCSRSSDRVLDRQVVAVVRPSCRSCRCLLVVTWSTTQFGTLMPRRPASRCRSITTFLHDVAAAAAAEEDRADLRQRGRVTAHAEAAQRHPSRPRRRPASGRWPARGARSGPNRCVSVWARVVDRELPGTRASTRRPPGAAGCRRRTPGPGQAAIG